MNERECTFKIVVFVNGQRKEINCTPETGCLKNLVWSGIGVKNAAAIALGLPNPNGVDAYVKGSCSEKSNQFSSLKSSI